MDEITGILALDQKNPATVYERRMESEPQPRRLDHYELLEKIGQGGMGVVYRARDTRLRRIVAIKVLPAALAHDRERRARFLREAQAAAKLNHPCVATVHEVRETRTDDEEFAGVDGEAIYIAMEYVAGEDLGPRIKSGLSLDEALDFGIQLADGLNGAHQAGVIHRDLKPGNIRVTPEARIKILDFGLAKVTQRPDEPESEADAETFKTIAEKVMGTIPYIAPESFYGASLDARSDLFSLGVVLFQMLTGHPPYKVTRLVDYVKAFVDAKPVPPSTSNGAVPPRLDHVVMRLLAKDPQDRYSSAEEVREELEAVLRGDSGTSGLPDEATLQLSTQQVAAIARTGTDQISRPSGSSYQLSRLMPRWWKAVIPLILVLLAVATYVIWLPPPIHNVAVLPYENLTGDPGLDPIYEGVGIWVSVQLSRVPELNVVTEQVAERYRGTDLSLEEIAAELGVGTLIQGQVLGDGEQIRIVTRLLNTDPAVSIWSNEVVGTHDQLMDLLARLTDEVITSLAVSLSPTARRHLRTDPARLQRAFEIHFRGMKALERVDDPSAAEEAIEFFSDAIDVDPRFSLAYAGLSRALLRRYDETRLPELLEKAEEMADEAVRLEPGLAELRIARARVWRRSGKAAEAVADLRQVLELHPRNDLVHQELAISFEQLSDLRHAERSYIRARDIRPSYWGHWNRLGAFYMKEARHPEARDQLRRALELAPPDIIRPLENLGTLELHEGNLEAALTTYQKIPRHLWTVSLFVNLGNAAFGQGNLALAEEYFQEALDLQPEEPVHWLNLADTLRRRGDEAKALESYRGGAQRIREQIPRNPQDNRLRTLLPLFLAKEDKCGQATDAALILRGSLTDQPELLYLIAKTFAVCQARDNALKAIDDLVTQGIPAERFCGEVEFESLCQAPEFKAIVGGRL